MKPQKLIGKVLIAVLAIAIVTYTVIQLLTIFTTSVETEYALLTGVEEKIESIAYIVRDETVLYSDLTGTNSYMALDGEKIPAKSSAVTVYANTMDADAQRKIEALEKKLDVLKNSSIDSAYVVSDVSSIDKNLYEMVYSIRGYCNSGKYSLALLQDEDFIVEMNKRQLMVKSVISFSDSIAALEGQIASLAGNMNGVAGTVTTPVSGYFYSDVDGYEGLFSSTIINGMTPEKFENMISTNSPADTSRAKGKVATTHFWYPCAIISKEEGAKIVKGKTYQLDFPYSSGVRVKGKLISKTESDDGEDVFVCFEVSEVPSQMEYMRSQNMNIIVTSYEGLQIPKSALRMVDSKEGVFVLVGSEVRFKKVERVFENEGYYIVRLLSSADEGFRSSVALNDQVIVSGQDLYDGKIVE